MSDSRRTLLELDHVSKSFGGIQAVRELSLSLAEEEILGLVGPNGAGKTTAFNLIAGGYKPDSGRIIFNGMKISGLKPHRISRAGISRTFQIVRPFGRMTVLENVCVGALFGRERTFGLKSARNEGMKLLDYVGLREKANILASSLSLAEQRRLELARALAAKPKLLMLDEVMAGLNFGEIQATLELIKNLRSEKKVTFLIIEHVMKAMVQISDRLVVMDHGEKIAEGSPSEVIEDASVITAFMGEKRAGRQKQFTTSSNPDMEKDP